MVLSRNILSGMHPSLVLVPDCNNDGVTQSCLKPRGILYKHMYR